MNYQNTKKMELTMGKDVTKQIVKSMEKLHVMCFIKHYESTYHTVLKLYIVDIMDNEKNVPERKISEKGAVISSSDKVQCSQFFSPCLKIVLQSLATEISRALCRQAAPHSHMFPNYRANQPLRLQQKLMQALQRKFGPKRTSACN
ncbi:ATP-binding cassette sub-family D member 2, partial [Striga asiatica]